ncbi:MAG: sigma-70 family RNA polymerase sigma factor [Bacteroidales bacterium]|nr:sigma-70 family RNA polymerase sigma factor [Bacteroidales bacterium]MCF8454766.1 sigma-70 family RNA polymerase sigma factor [Bacteroidales bacterium]
MTAIEFNDQLIGLENNLKGFALSLTSNPNEAQDLLQETFLKALKYKEQFVEKTNLKAWAYTIMKNTFINNYRRAVKQNTTFDSTKDLYFLNLSQDSGFDSPDSKYSTSEILKAISALEDEYRKPFEMHVEGFKYKEIAEQLELPIGTVKSRIFFTRKKLMATLKDFRMN